MNAVSVFSTSLWNGNDSILKEHLFGLSNPEGNHGEDVKELYYYLDATPTHSYAKALYKYPHCAFPYETLLDQNRQRGFQDKEFELLDTGVFNDDRYFDVLIEYAKLDPEDMFICITISNRGPEEATITVLPTLTFRNEWSSPIEGADSNARPSLTKDSQGGMSAEHVALGCYSLLPIGMAGGPPLDAQIIFTENETNQCRLDSSLAKAASACKKDAFDRYVIHAESDAVSPHDCGTKAAFVYRLTLQPHVERVLTFRLVRVLDGQILSDSPFDASLLFDKRCREADDFYSTRVPDATSTDEKNISRQAYAGLLWSKQFYHYIGEDWASESSPHTSRPKGNEKNRGWGHLYCRDVLSVPDKWEYPWFAAWDLAFHMVPMATMNSAFAKSQLLLLLREWYLHPNGQMPAYEFNFSDVNPPVHAWAVWHVYRTTKAGAAEGDLDFLERAFQYF